jgi:hypothetical protein
MINFESLINELKFAFLKLRNWVLIFSENFSIYIPRGRQFPRWMYYNVSSPNRPIPSLARYLYLSKAQQCGAFHGL